MLLLFSLKNWVVVALVSSWFVFSLEKGVRCSTNDSEQTDINSQNLFEDVVQSCIGFALLKFIDYLKNNPGNSSENDNSIEEHPTKYIFIYKGIQSIFKKNFTLDINLKK